MNNILNRNRFKSHITGKKDNLCYACRRANPCWVCGFTIFEVLIAGTIIAILSVGMIWNFRSSANNITARNQSTAAIIAAIRRAQSLSINGTAYTNQNISHVVCGYGLHYSGYNTSYSSFNPLDSTATGNSYVIYGKLRPGPGETGSCNAIGTRNYVDGSDFIIEKFILANSSMDIKAACNDGSARSFNNTDIFFEPPNPKTYVNNQSTLGAQPVDVVIKAKPNSDCSAPYSVIRVNTSGAINVCSRPDVVCVL